MNAVIPEETPTDEQTQYLGDASYDPADNRIRCRFLRRLPKDIYDRVKAAGFRWAPKQDLFFAPSWSPEAEDLALELCGEIGDEDTSLVERAEERAERFEGYQANRARDAANAHAAVDRIADGIPMGQPILCGHHSEKRARRDAEKIRSGMTRAVNLWKTSKYWEDRAAGALRHAKYTENPAVRHRRIKGLEADRRKHLKDREASRTFLGAWMKEGLTREGAMGIANYDHTSLWFDLDREKITVEEAVTRATTNHENVIARAERWVEHLDNRLTYERAMLAESGGVASDHFDIQVGGRAQCRDGWFVVKGVNRSEGKVTSVSLFGTYVRGIETVIGYQAPSAEDVAKVKAATKLPPIVNFPGAGFLELTKAEWDRHVKCQRGTMRRAKATDEHGPYRYRDTYLPGGSFKCAQVFVTDAKVVERPRVASPVDTSAIAPQRTPRVSVPRVAPEPTVFDAMAESLKAGVTVVSAPQLFPTPADLADRMVDEAGIREAVRQNPSLRVLEPSAGTGHIVKAIQKAGVDPVAVEINLTLCRLLEEIGNDVHCADFLEMTPTGGTSETDLGHFDRILANPPFAEGADVRHVTHALAFLKPGGRLVAIMSAGVLFRQDKATTAFRQLVEEHGGTIEELPVGTFKESGTGVRTVLVVIGV